MVDSNGITHIAHNMSIISRQGKAISLTIISNNLHENTKTSICEMLLILLAIL